MVNKYIRNLNVHKYIPEDKNEYLTGQMLHKIDYLSNHNKVEEIYILPDFTDEQFSLSGIQFSSKDIIFPIASGWDIGCGYRLFNTNQKKEDLSFLKDSFDMLSKELTTPYSKKVNDSGNLFNDISNWLLEHEISSKSKLDEFSSLKNYETLIDLNSVMNELGNIAPGNHFIEFREVHRILNKEKAEKLNIHQGDILIHIHSGAGLTVKHNLMKYFAKFYSQTFGDVKLTLNFNGYLLNTPINSDLGRDFYNNALLSKFIAFANREYLTSNLKSKVPQLETILDVVHDDIKISDNVVSYQKGVQTFSNVNELEIAIIPGTISDSTFIIEKTGKVPFINHGVGEGDGGSKASFDQVITNLKNPLDRKYYSIQKIIDYGKLTELFEPIVELTPWLAIKNGGG